MNTTHDQESNNTKAPSNKTSMRGLVQKSTLVTALLVLAGSALVASAQGSAALESKIKEALLKQPSNRMYATITVKASPLQVPKAETCLAAKVYAVKISKQQKSGNSTSTSIEDLLYAEMPTGSVDISLPGTDQEIPAFLKILNPAFRLAKPADGDLMLSVLTALYPEASAGFGDKVKPRVERKETTWNFIMGKFFEKNKGFTFKTDAAGKITTVAYSLSLGDASNTKDEKIKTKETQKAGDGLTSHQEKEGVSLTVKLDKKEVERMNREGLKLAQALEKGTPCTVDYTHPLTQETMKIKVLRSGSYDMALPGKAKMEVRLTPANAKLNLNYLKAMGSAKEFTSEGNPIVNGKAVPNVISDLMDKNNGEVKLIIPEK